MILALALAAASLSAAKAPSGLKFKWTAAPGITALPGCATGKRPCYRYTLTQNGVVKAHPQPNMTQYTLPMPGRGTYLYILQTDRISATGVITSSKFNPKVTYTVQ
jgi:hypothetical protein